MKPGIVVLKRIMLIILLLQVNQYTFSQRPAPVVSPEYHADGSFTFRFRAPAATEVRLNGQFMSGERVMTKDASGLWSITIDPVKPDIYPYHFVVDGVRVADPLNNDIFPNEGFQSSLVDIPGPAGMLHVSQNVPRGTVSYKYYHTSRSGARPVVVYTPPGYEKEAHKNYPVLYLLHGSTDTEETWFKVGRTNIILDNLIARGEAEPMIIVMPYGRVIPTSIAPGSLRDADNLQAFHTEFKEYILPFIHENFRAIDSPAHRAIAGFSGGGGQSLYLGLSNPDLFSWVCGFAPGMRPEEIEANNAVPFADPALTNERLKLFWIGCGTDDGLYPVVSQYLNILEEKGINHMKYITPGGHTWMNCRLYLSEISKLLFK